MLLETPFSLPNPLATRRFGRAAAGMPLRVAERLLGLARLNRMYGTWTASASREPRAFPDAALDLLGIRYDPSPAALERIPSTGGLVVVANHPHGALDGLVLASLLLRRRDDVRLLGNFLLSRIPELRPLCIFVDPFGERGAARRNASGMREALAWVAQGGVLVTFPAGEVSHASSPWSAVADPAWHAAPARLAERTAAPVLPVHISGGNSRLFQLAGLVHPRLRTALLARELLRQGGRRVEVHPGTPIPWSRLAVLPSVEARTSYLRVRAYGLAPASRDPWQVRTPETPGWSRGSSDPRPSSRPASVPMREGSSGRRTPGAPLVEAVPPSLLAGEIASLGVDDVLLAHEDFQVFCTRAHRIPRALAEIGRLREITFRGVGEGTGSATDLDRYDADYWHLFVWNDRRREIAGAYRLGATDELGAHRRPGRLYTRSLFRFDGSLLARLGPALELGRSFVRAEYQRDYGTLLLLWKGIGRFVTQRPRYRFLFGPISISAAYRQTSRELLVAALSAPRFRSPLASLVRPMHPVRSVIGEVAPILTAGPGQIDRLLAEIDDGRTMPVLLRQYLKLNARFLSFSVDPGFGDVVDGLAVVDLLDVDPSVLQRYMGRAGLAGFLAHHRHSDAAPLGAEPAVVSVGV